MKKILLPVGLFLWVIGTAQKMPSDYFEEAAAFVQAKDYSKAIASYQYLVANHRKNELYPEAFYNLAYTHYLRADYTDAVKEFRAILSGDFDDRKPVGGSIMASPYANFKHNASSLLSRIYYDQKKWDSALYYLALSDSVYPYQHFCGNAYAEQALALALQYADLYQKTGQPDKALKALLPSVFANFLADNTQVLEDLEKLLQQQKKTGLKKELDKALDNLYTKPAGKGSTTWYFSFLDHEIEAPYVQEKEGSGKTAVQQAIRESAFYKTVAAL